LHADHLHPAQTEAYEEAHATFSEREYEADCKHERAVEADRERTNTAAMVVENMHRDAQHQMDQHGLLEYDLGDAMVNVALKKENIEASDVLTRLRSDKSDALMQRFRDSNRAKRTRINVLEASISSTPFFPASKKRRDAATERDGAKGPLAVTQVWRVFLYLHTYIYIYIIRMCKYTYIYVPVFRVCTTIIPNCWSGQYDTHNCCLFL